MTLKIGALFRAFGSPFPCVNRAGLSLGQGLLKASLLTCFIAGGVQNAWAQLSLTAPTTTWNVTPQPKNFPTDRACPTGTLVSDAFQSVTEGVGDSETTLNFDVNGVNVAITITTHVDNSFDFSVVGGVLPQMFVKGSNYLLYQYDPAVAGATNTGPVSSDTGLHDGYVAGGTTYQDVSHLDFCVIPTVPLTSEKTAVGSYDRTITWELDKSVDPALHTGKAGEEAGKSTWTVVATKNETLGNYQVVGAITVYNDNGFAVPVTITDVLNDGTVATVNCPSNSVPASGSLVCTYAASPLNASATLNTATIVSGNPAVSAGEPATAAVSFTENVFGDASVTVGDDRGPLEGDISETKTFNYDETFNCSSVAGDYTDGEDEDSYVNIATLTGANTDLSDDATVTVTCTLDPVVPSKDAAGSYDRTVTWDLSKTVDVLTQEGYAGDEFDIIWTVEATKSEVSDNYMVTGNISVSNPSAVTQTVTGIADVLDDGAIATVDCGGAAFPIDIPAGETLNCTYEAMPTDKLATLNTATVSAVGNADQDATAAVSFTENLIGFDTATLADPSQDNFSKEIDDDTTENFPDTLACPTDAGLYFDGGGTYSFKETNVATLKNGDTDLADEASADVDVICEAGTIDVLKLTDGAVNGSYNWQFALFIGPDGFGGAQVGNTSSTLGDVDGILDFGDPVPALRPDETYTVCELSVAAGWATEWSIGGVTVLPYNPDADNIPPEDVGNRCFDVGFGTSYAVEVGETLRITVDNTFPGGDPRTPGYWKNWSSCTGGGQFAKTTDDVDPFNEFVSLDEVLNSPGIKWDDILTDEFVFAITSCDDAVAILDKRDLVTGKKAASDPLVNLATSLLAAQLNFGAGACTTQDVLDAALAAETLLDKYNFDGTAGKLPKGKAASEDAAIAQQLQKYLDEYNNGWYCGSLI